MKVTFSKIWNVVKNRYVLATLIFLLVIFFLSENNVRVIHRLKRELSSLNKEADMIQKGLEQDSIEAMNLFDNPEALEAYGREHYYMKRPDEDIFIIKNAPER